MTVQSWLQKYKTFPMKCLECSIYECTGKSRLHRKSKRKIKTTVNEMGTFQINLLGRFVEPSNRSRTIGLGRKNKRPYFGPNENTRFAKMFATYSPHTLDHAQVWTFSLGDISVCNIITSGNWARGDAAAAVSLNAQKSDMIISRESNANGTDL